MNDIDLSYRLGKMLLGLRPRHRKGEWISLLREMSAVFHVPLSQPTAWRHMEHARRVDQTKGGVTR